VKKSDLVRLKYNENDFTGVTFSFNYTSDRLKWTTGGAANYYEGDHYGRIAWIRNYVGTLDARQKYYDNTGRKTDVNVYTRADYRLTDELSAFADLQYRNLHYKINGVSDEFNDDTDALDVLDVHRTWNFFNPKVGLNYEQGNNRLYASWSVAHREPMRNNFTEGDHSHNPSAERLFDYEVGYAYNSRLFSVGLNYYYMDYKDQLVATGELSDTGNPLTVNVPDSYRTGVELQGSYRPAKWFDWSLNATFSRNRIKNYTYYLYDWDAYEAKSFTAKSAQIAYSPDFIGNNVFHFHVQGFDASLATKYVSKQYMSNVKDDALKIDAYCVSDLHLSYTFRKIAGVEALTLGCHVYNLFNEEYENYGYVYDSGLNADGTPYYDTRYSAQAPTHVMGTVTLKF
jgi:iron complex outermembrane receptor protein